MYKWRKILCYFGFHKKEWKKQFETPWFTASEERCAFCNLVFNYFPRNIKELYPI